MSIADQSFKSFVEQRGQDKLTDYPLSSRSIVFDVGGYKGQWTADLLDRYNFTCEHCGSKIDPTVHIFEPISQFAQYCSERFKDYPRVKIHNFGLSNTDKSAQIVIDEAASCLHGPCPWRPNDPKPMENVVLRDIDAFLNESKINFIELMSIIIEGEEYALLRRIISSGAINRIRHIQVQFHEFIDSSTLERNALREMLSQTHKLNFDYPFVWESWSLK